MPNDRENGIGCACQKEERKEGWMDGLVILMGMRDG